MYTGDFETLSYTFSPEGLAVIRLLGPGLSRQTIREFSDALEHLDSMPGPRFFLTCGPEGSIFCGGIHLATFMGSHTDACSVLGEFSFLVGKLLRLGCPSAALMSGHAVAGGLMLAAAHDFRVAVDDDSRLIMNELKYGMGVPRSMAAALLAKFSPSVKRDLMLRLAVLSPREAQLRGVVDLLAKDRDELMRKGLELAHKFKGLADKNGAYKAIKVAMFAPYVAMARSNDEEESIEALRVFMTKL